MKLKILMALPSDSQINDLMYSMHEDENYELTISDNIEDTLIFADQKSFDLLIMDMMFKDGTGLDLKKKLNEICDIPTIVVTTLKDDMQKILTFEYGADDYLIYPFNVLELKARIRAIMRRVGQKRTDIDNLIFADDLEFNIVGRTVKLKGEEVDLTGKEFDILYIIAINPEKVFTREDIAKSVWKEEHVSDYRKIDVHIRRLREKINIGNVTYIQTKWGEGYYYKKLQM
ncbi:MAG: response regulator transcription factor [Peptoniphilaceae bacterium]|uniref:response regulator transcription factor n=1 Tax=Parvimonas sp. TaxID=1944660 RepID=UPI0025CD3D0F|nr:response regulator transcription factor [Parvimonas sp.]MCI5997497.1 response regulator transcription factor [Parvimonas sp.]MDD7764606.1 response regulator transcription factor [Peptoniphilaceae bacterium]MDY3050582.1 response regulator transcription factor [Parvimonas sp.]